MLNLFKKHKKQESQLLYVTVRLDNHKGEVFDKVIYVPRGYTFVKEFAENDTLLDENGCIVEIFEWCPGYSCFYTYTYGNPEDE